MIVIEIIGVLAIGCVISFIAIHFWVFIWDCIIGRLKRLFGIGKRKKTIRWHTLDNSTAQKNDTDITKSDSKIIENKNIY